MAWVGPIENVEFSSSANAATLTFSPAATIPAGTLVIIPWAANGNLAATSCSDNSSQSGTANSYTILGGVVSAALAGSNIYCFTTRAILSSNTITVTLGSSTTRRNGRLLTFTGARSVAPLDLGLNVAPSATNPIVIGPTSATGQNISNVNSLAIAFSFWLGGAVASGVSDSTSGYTLSPAAGSGGTSTRVEVNVSYKKTAGLASETDTQSFTSITSAGGQIAVFKPSTNWTLTCVSNTNTSPTRALVNAAWPALDTFNAGPNQALSVRSGWAPGHISNSTIDLVTDSVPTKAVGAASADNYWAAQVSGDVESWVTFASTPGGTVYVYARLTSVNPPTGYLLAYSGTAVNISKFVAGTGTTLSSTVALTVSSGDSLGIRIVGTTISGHYKPSGGLWTEIVSVVDSSITTPGYIGVRTSTAGDSIDTFGGTSTGVGQYITAISKLELLVSNDTYLGDNTILGDGNNSPAVASKFARKRTFAARSFNGLFELGGFKLGIGPNMAAITRNPTRTITAVSNTNTSTARVSVTLPNLRAFSVANTSISNAIMRRARKIGAISDYGFIMGQGVLGTTVLGSYGQSSGRVFLAHIFNYAARSTGTSTAQARLGPSLNCFSSGSSGALVTLTRTRKFIAVSTSSSPSLVLFGIARIITARSNNTSGVVTTLNRFRPTAAIVRSTSTGIVIPAGAVKSFVAVSTGSSSARVNVVKTINAISTGSSTAIAASRRTRAFQAVAPSLTPYLPFVLGQFTLGLANSNAVVKFSGTTKTLLAKSGYDLYVGPNTYLGDNTYLGIGPNSASTARFTRTRLLGAISDTGFTLGQNTLGNGVLGSHSNSPSTASMLRIKNFAAISQAGLYPGFYPGQFYPGQGYNSTGIARTVNISSKLITAVSSGTSTGNVPTPPRYRTFGAYSVYGTVVGGFVIGDAIGPLGNSRGYARMGYVKKFAAISSGISSGRARVGNKQTIYAASRNELIVPFNVPVNLGQGGTATALLAKVRKFGAYSWGSLYPSDIMPGTIYPGVGFNSGAVAFLSSNIKIISAVSSGQSGGVVTFQRAKVITAITQANSPTVASMVRARASAAVTIGNSPTLVTFTRARVFAAVSGAELYLPADLPLDFGPRVNSAAIVNLVPNRGIIAVSTNVVSPSTARFTRALVLFAATANTSPSTSTIYVLGTHYYVSDDVSGATGTFARMRTLNAVSTGSSRTQAVMPRTRGFAALSNNTSTVRATATRKRAFAALTNNTSSARVTLAPFIGNAAVSTGSSSARTIISRARASFVRYDSNSTGVVTSIIEYQELYARSSSGGQSLVTVAIGISASVMSSSTGSSTGVVDLPVVHAINANSNSFSRGYARFLNAKIITAVSTGRGCATVKIANVNQYGTVKIHDRITYRLDARDNVLYKLQIHDRLRELYILDK